MQAALQECTHRIRPLHPQQRARLRAAGTVAARLPPGHARPVVLRGMRHPAASTVQRLLSAFALAALPHVHFLLLLLAAAPRARSVGAALAVATVSATARRSSALLQPGDCGCSYGKRFE